MPISNMPTLINRSQFPFQPTETAAKGFEAELMGGAVPRKLTRSLSARVSRLAAAAKTAHTDTDSEADDKHNDKK